MADTSQVKEITAKLKDGIMDLFESDKYAEYLKTMSKFHNYSTNNTLLIHMQRPSATAVAGFQAWQNKFGRHVKKGEKAIKIFAPTPFVIREEKEKLDPETKMPVLDNEGSPIIEVNEKRFARFKVTSVFDVSQTQGKPLPVLAQDLSGNVEQYEAFIDALKAVSSLPIVFEPLPENQDGVCRFGDKIAIREGMSQIQTVSAAIHEMTHAKLHDRSIIVNDDGDAPERKDRRTEEVEAESISYAVCQYFGIETGDNSFGYVAAWSKGKELKELNASLDAIRKTATELIDAIDGKFQEIVKERNIVIAVGEEQETLSEQAADTTEPGTSSSFRDTREIGTTVLMPLLFNDEGNLERTDKRSRVQIEPPIGKYQIYSRKYGGSVYAYLMTDSGKLINSGSPYDRIKNLEESRIDEFFAQNRETVEKSLQDPGAWVDYTAAAIANRLDEAEAHNAPVFAARQAQSGRTPTTAAKEKAITIEDKLHQKFAALFPKVVTGEYSYLRLEAGGGMEPLSLEWIDDDKISIMHTYTVNGDLCYDPMIVLKIDNDRKTLTAVEYEQSIPPLYQRVYEDGTGASIDGNGNEKEIKNLQADINGFVSQWFDNIEDQGYIPVKANMVLSEDESVRITFDEDGNPIMPESEKQRNLPGYSEDGVFIRQFAILNEHVSDVSAEMKINNINFTFTEGYTDYLTFYVIPDEADAAKCKDILSNLNIENLFGLSEEELKPLAETAYQQKPAATEKTDLELSLPDPTISILEMNEYGYTQDDMYPLSVGRAVELFDTGHTIYMLWDDNTEVMVLDTDEIITFGNEGFLGITYADWELSPVRAAQLAVASNSEGSREAELLYGDGDRFGIYQLKDGDETRDYRFESFEHLQKHGLSVNRSNYNLVYTDNLSGTIKSADDVRLALNELYDEFNTNHPGDFKGHSLSVSDIVVLKYGNNISTHYVDVTGFEGLAGFLGDEQHEVLFTKPVIEKLTNNITSSQVGNTPKQDRSDAPKGRPSLMERVEHGKEKVAQQGQPDANKAKIREV